MRVSTGGSAMKNLEELYRQHNEAAKAAPRPRDGKRNAQGKHKDGLSFRPCAVELVISEKDKKEE